ncbi:MAG: PocR ligand-binding domain-containing protein [bacterium]|nr:PocR ligand-binding domain-containing protein [bacterium]MDY4098750.1 PocR ligand-binding domain-containing protein [Lachnospiraceae bacterium]
MDELKLTDLISNHILIELQKMIIEKNGIEIGLCCSDGSFITSSRIINPFCEEYIKKAPEGKRRCDACDRENATRCCDTGKAALYICHAGLIDFSVPIVVEGKQYGFLIGGQVTTRALTRAQTDTIADEIGIDKDELYAVSKTIPIVSQVQIDQAVEDVEWISNIIAEIASNKLQVMRANREIEAAAKMKSDFLANMSHEIRTPMNAIVGMSDMALRETDLEMVKTHVRQIKRSSGMLLTIINDILDFSKIESGKMEINMNEYSPMQLVDDIVHILQTRIKGNQVALIVDVDPMLPGKLMGDEIRIKQIITNIANNAIKFTHEGKVYISVNCKDAGPRMKELQVSVKDTGIGIKEEDLKKIFDSFQQVDSKRNRNIEGSGLGLTISRNLLELMNGKLTVESEYGVGSTFSFILPQLELTEEAPKTVQHPEKVDALICVSNPYREQQMIRDLHRLGCQASAVGQAKKHWDEYSHIFIDYDFLDEKFIELVNERTDDIKVVVIDGYVDSHDSPIRNAAIVNKPLYSYNILRILNNEAFMIHEDKDEMVEITFTAPEAKILVVDDNEVNLAVCVGLLKPLNAQIETAISGAEAIDMISNKMYDLIFMDHMMPEMDGIETTHIIRRMHPEYDDVPIIALTANALENAKGMFLVEGMNDFMAKPIEFSVLLQMVRNWLPKDKIIELEQAEPVAKNQEEELNIPELDVKEAVRLIGSVSIYKDVLNQYYKNIEKKKQVIKASYESGDWERYTTEVHALKSSSRQIGAVELGALAEKLEMAGKARDMGVIMENTVDLLEKYEAIKETLTPYFSTSEENQNTIERSDEEIRDTLQQLKEAIADLDSTTIEELIQTLTSVSDREPMCTWSKQMKEAAEEYDFELCENLTDQWMEKMSETK